LQKDKEMISSEKKVKELEVKLNDKNLATVVAAIDSLRNTAPFSGAIHLLADIYDSTEISMIRDHIRSVLNDLKEISLRTEVIAEIKQSHSGETLAMLVSSCWQSGLDYSEWASDLVRIFCISDFLIALECFTVLEESSHSLPPEKKKELIAVLKEKDNNIIPEKSALRRELISIMS
jgi:hypothetical protein